MSGDKFDQLYNALKADGAVSGSRANFRNFVYASGKQGYQNRKKLYDALHADGAVSSKSYEEFAQRLGLHATNPQPRAATSQPKQQASKPQTAAQMAMAQGYRKPQQRVQQPQQQARTQQPRSAFVQGLYDQDDAQRQQHIDYTSPKATQQMVTTRQNAQRQATRKAADTIVNSEQRRRNQPIVKTGTPADQNIIKTQGQWEQEMDASVNKLVNSDLGGYLDKVIGDEFKNAHARGLAALSAAGGPYAHGTGGADWYVGERAYQQQMDSQKQLENITGNIQRNIEATFSDPKIKKRVMDDAARLGVDPEQYITQHLAPALIQKAGDQFNKTQLNRMMAKGASDYIASGILSSLTGTLLTGLTTSKNQRQMQQEADAMTEEGLNPNYRPGIVGKAARGAVGFMADAPAFNLAGKAGAMVAGRVLGNGVAQAARLANMSKLQRAVYMAKNGAVSQGVTGILYGSTNAVAQNMSTGDDNSIGTNLKLALKGGLSEGASFATMGSIGGVVGGMGYGIGANWREPSFGKTVKNAFKKIGYEGFKVVSEGIGMHVGGQVANLIENGKFDLSVSGTLEDVANVVALKLTHAPKLSRMRGEDGKKESISDAITRKFGEFVTSDAEKNRMWELTNDDKDAIMASGGLANVKDMNGIKSSYQKIMADPNVSWDAKAKYSAMVMGVMPSSRPMGDYHTFTFEKVGGDKAGYKKYISEYAADGTLLSKRSYNTADERENALYNDAILKENTRLGNGFALSVDADTNDRELQAEFLRSKGFDESKPLDYHVNRTLAAGMQDHDSAIYREFVNYAANHGETGRIVDAVAQQNGMTREQLVDAFQNKDALKRTDAEQNACVQLRRAFEGAVFKQGESHPEQSQIEGKDVATDNNLGSEQPNPQPVVEELRNLRAAEQALDQAMDGNDVFKQVFEQCQKQGIRPVDAYDVLIQNGLTQEEIAPLADYINANARVQGMQTATQQAIEEHVGARISDWSYHGTLNGEATEKGTTMLHVNWNGKDYIVGNGDVAFDSTGRAKEDVGEMLVCLDPETNQMEYIPAREVTLAGTEKAEDYAAKYRQQLQMINSQPYNQAAQEQAMQDAAKPQQEEETRENKDEEGKGNDAVSGVEEPQQGTKATVEGVEEAKGNAASKPVEQPQQVRKFADGTDVPMTKDSKGRPTPDYGAMKPEQAAEILTQDFGENAEKVVNGQIKKAEQALKDAEKMKVDYSAEPNDILEQEQVKAKTVDAAKKQLEQAQNIKKAMTAKKVAETVGKTDEAKVEGAHEAGSVAAEKFQKAPRLQGNHVSKRLPTGEKISGHYEIVPAESLTPSHDVNNGYKKSEGFPVDAEGRTINDRDYENDKGAQRVTDQMAQKYSGQAITQVPTVSDEGIVYDGNGRTMAGQKAAKNGTDAEYIEDLMDNAQNYGFTKEQIAESGIEHPRLVMVTDERLSYDAATFAKFNRNEKKTQSNTEQAVAKAKTLTADEVGAIVADIEGNGSLDAFFNNSKAINDLVKTLVDKGVIGQNEVEGFMDGPERLSAQGKEYVKNLLLGSVFKPETIRMLGVDSKIKNAAINGIRAIMDNLKLGDYSLRDEIDQAIQLLYEARRNKMSVDDLLRQNSAFDENARDRFPMIAQAMAQALDGNIATFRELMNEYNAIAKNYNTNEGTLDFYDKLTPEQVVEEFLNASKAIKNNNIKLYGKESETERSNDASSNEEPAKEAGAAVGTEGNGNAETEPEIKVKKALKRIATEITKQTGIEVVTDDKVGQSALEDAEATDSNVKFHKETDEDVLNQLNSGETIKVYRAMQVIDGKLYPPMAASVGGKLVEANELGVWIRADENPNLAIPDIDPKTGKQKVDKKTGELKWKFVLDKGGKDATGKKATSVPAAYNPYWHLSRSPLNDQFKSAWIRPNIVVVECEVPASELTSGYKADRAKDAVGEVDWKSGSVSGEVFKQTGRARKVILSRWCKPVRVLDDAEVAQRAKEFIGDAKVEIPENVLTPKQRVAFEEAGFKIGAPEKGVKKSEQILEALEKGLQIDNSVREQRGGRWAGGEVLGMNKLPKENRMNPNELASEITQYHGDFIAKAFDGQPEDSTGVFVSCHNGVWYVYSVSKEDRSINIFDAIPAKREEFDKFKKQVEGYGFDTNAENIFSNLQKNGNTDRRDSDLLDAFLRGGLEPSNRVHSGESKGEANDGTSGLAEQTGRANNESDETRTSPLKEFRSANGEVYGFTVDGKIYLDTKKMKPETPLHEYTHLWTEALRNSNPTEWENVKKLFDEVDGLKEEVSKLYPELKGDDLYEEMITTFSGREGAKKLEEVVRGLAAEDGKTVEESAKATSFISKVKEALLKYWKGVADMLHIHFTSAEDVADKVLADWASGFNPTNFDDLHDKELESRIKVTDEETETPSDNGPITKQKILIDGDKEVIKVDEPNEKGEYTGSYYEYDGKKFGDLREVADYIDGNGKQEKLPVMPKPVEPSNPIEKVAEDYKKEHPLTEDEILNTTAFDDLPEDQKQYCIDAAIDYLNGEDNSSIAEAYYRNAYEKRAMPAEGKTLPKPEQKIAQDEQKTISPDPMEGLKNAAEGYEKEKNAPKVETATPEKPKTRKQLEAEKNAADNEFEAFMKDLRKKRSGQLNSGFIDQNLIEAAPKMFSLAAKCAYTRIKLGMYDAKEVVKDLRERFKEAFDGFDKRDIETFYSEIMNQKWRDGDKRMSLNEWAEHYRKLSPEYKEKLEGDSKDAEERKQQEASFIGKMRTRIIFSTPVKSITEMRKIAESCGLKDVKDTDLQELAETAVSQLCREVCESKAMSDDVKFRKIKHIYDNQPSLNQRDSERVMKQQYSTPAPYAFLADMYVKGNGKEVKSALEPSAGNGMLTIGLPMDAVHVNDIDAQRLANLRRQGFKNVTSQDATQPFADKDVDVVVTNPPFGSATPKEYDGYKIGSLEGQMAINALESMKDDGRAAIIIGGKTEYAKNGSLNPKDKAFLGYLYSHYNVEDVINVDGSLYAKQGTTYPTRIILINGRRLDENAFPPVKSKARAEAVKDYNELYKRINDDILRGERMDSSIGEGERSARPELDRPSSADSHEEGVRAGGERGGEQKPSDGAERLSSEPSVPGANDVLDNRPTAEREPDGGLSDGNREPDRTGTEPSESEGTEAKANEQRVSGRRGLGGDNSQPSTSEPTDNGGGRPRGQLQRMDESVRGLSTEKVTYKPKSGNPFTLKAVMPADQQEAVNKNLEKLGDADQFLVDELGYNDKDDLYSHLAAEQVDSVALALQQAKKGNAFIIGDMTGIGKGRQAASLIRYAKKQGQVPVYFTKTAGLLSDVYRDLVDIGSPELRPFVFGSAKEAAITDSDGNVVFPLPSKNEVKRVLDYIEKNGELPKEYDYVLTTYSQVSNGVYEFDENGNRKERKIGKNKSFGAAALNGQRRRDAIEKLMDNGYLILDESHTAGGDSGQGNYFQHIIQKAKNVTFFSATFAKRPDNMPIYALRTAMNQGGLKSSDLIDAVKRGGATLQEIMSQTLTQCGQMIRRERDMTGVTIDWRAIDEPEKVKEQREQYDSIIGLFNDIINFQKTYVSHYVEDQNEAMAAMQATMGIKRGTEALGIKNVPFASKAFNTVQQVLLSLKAKSAAERAIDYLKQGMKPVIALNNTNESQTGNIALGEEMDAPDLGTSLRKGLEGTLRYTSKNAKDESSSGYIRLEDLGDDAVEAYHNLEKKIKETSTGLSLSPIDVIKNELEKAGYKVGELTGRQTEFVYNDNGTVTKVKRADTDKKKLAREFNDGQIDALILNKSAATGISLHASSKYKDQRKRVMIVAQQQLDVNDEVQMRGRIDRTGQVARGAYEYVVSLIPAEQRLLMMFKAKLKSLDANTTSSQKSKFNEMEVADITNKYGDKVVREYMAEHLDLYSRMADPFGWEKTYGDDLSSVSSAKLVNTANEGRGNGEAGSDASKLLGRMALLKVAEQEKMLNEIGELYANEIQRLNEMGENDLEITELPLKAKTISKEVWKEGAEPGGDNAFADNTYIEKVNMAILKKPMKAEEVKKAQDGLTGGKSWDEYRESKKAAVKNFFDQKIADETQRYEERAVKVATKAKEKYLKDAKKGQKDSGMSDEQIEKNAGYQYDTIYKQEKDKLNDVVKNLDAKAEMFNRVLDTFNTEDAYVLPVDMNKPDELSGFGNSYGRLIDIKITDNFSPNASSVSFATLDGRRKITFPIAGKVGSGENKSDVIAAIDRMTRQASGTGDKHLRVLSMDVNNWDKLVSNESRKDGYIVTGNLMQALIDSKNQGVGGQLVKYTTDIGEVKTGILMPDRFKPTDVANEYPISSVADKFELPSYKGGIEQAVSSDGEVKVILGFDHGDTYYQIQVPKSKAKGGKYFLDKDLLSMVRGHNFETRGNRMIANIDESQLHPVLARLSNLGVKVREERKPSEDGTHFREDRGVQYSKTDAKDVKNSRIIPEDVDKSVSSQIEKKFDDEMERLFGSESTTSKKGNIDRLAQRYAYNQSFDSYRFDKDGKPVETVEGLNSVIDSLSKDINQLRYKYGISDNEPIWKLVNDIKSFRKDTEGDSGARIRANSFRVRVSELGKGDLSQRAEALQILKEYTDKCAKKAAAERAKAYLAERIKTLANKYGFSDDSWISKENIDKLFNDYNSDPVSKQLYDKIKERLDEVQTKFWGNSDVKADREGYYHHRDNYIKLNIDLLSASGFDRQELASTLLHEMLHPLTSDIIAMYQKGHTDLLTKEQIDAAKDVVDIYKQLKSLYKEKGWKEPYALSQPTEMMTELASPEWRAELQKRGEGRSIWRRVVDAVRRFLGLTPKVPGVSDLNKALDKVLDNFGKKQFDFAAQHQDELFGRELNKLSDSPVSSHITQLSEKVGAKINEVSSVDEITNKRAKEAIEAGKNITGWYDEKTGEVHLYMPNIHDRYTAEKTIWHEVVGHKGMRELFGEDRFNKFLRDVWYDLDKPENADLKKLVDEEMRYNPFNVYDAIEEGIARLAEEGRGEAGFWRNLKNKVSDFLHEIGYRMVPNTKDVKYLLWLSKNLQKNPNDPYWKMRAEAVKYRLDHEEVPEVIAKDGMYQTNIDGKAKDLGDLPKAEYQEATDGQIHFRTTPSAGTALDRYHRSLDAHGYMFTESYMDNMLSLKNLMTAIMPGVKIEDIASSENPYILQNTMQGAMSDAAQMFERNVMKPLDKAMAQVLDAFDGKKDDEKIRNFNLYMITKHSLERNRILYVRDTLKDMRMDEKNKKLADTIENDWDNEKGKLDDELKRGDIDLKTYYERMDDFIRTYVDDTHKFDAGEHDYSGIHAIQEIEKSSDPYDDAAAIASVMDSESKMEDIKKGAVKDYWDKVKAATQYSLDTDYKNGLISRELYGHVSAMFNWYVPLRKYDEATAEDTYGYITEKGDPKSYIGSTIMRARGHKYLSETNVLAQIGAMGNRAINNGGKNAIKQAFARFIRNHSNNNLVTETSVWYADVPITHTTVERYPDIPEDATPDEISQIVSDFNAEMKDLESKGLATKVYRRGKIGYKFQRAENKSQHIVDVMIAGKKHSFIINGNPRAAQALNGLLENSAAKGVMKPLGTISRIMAQLCTSYNPEFVMRNIMRDAEFASSNVTAKEGARYGGLWAKYYAQLGLYKGASNIGMKDLQGSTGLGLFAKYRNGTLDTSDKIQRYFKEFMENGGETGWVQIKNMKEWEKQYKQDVKGERSKVQRGGKMVRDFFFGNLENLNEVAENIARFSTYCASRDFGRSIVRSTYDAKEVSTNFNRHGSGDAIKSFKNGEMNLAKEKRRWAYGFSSGYLRHCSMFFNAGIQSTNLLVKNLKNHPVGTSINMLSIPFALGALGALLNNALIASEDEKDRKGVKDPYGELPDYVRRNNLCIYKGGGEFVTIPLAIELRAFYGLGDLAVGLTFSPNVSGQKNPYFDALGCMSQLVPVMDYLGNSSAGKKPLEETIKAISPSAIAPFIEWEQNSDWKGAPIERRGEYNENVPAWQRAYNGTPEGLKSVNKWVNAQTNDVAKGNEDMLGNSFLDMVTNPSMLNHFFGGIGGGAATFAERALGTIKHGKDTETKDIPFVRSLFYTPSEQSSLQRTKSKWYNYKDEMEKTIANVDRLKSKNVPIDKRLTNVADYYNFQNSKDAAKVRVIELAEKQMKQWKKLRGKSGDTESIKFANENIDRIMMEAVEQLDKLN